MDRYYVTYLTMDPNYETDTKVFTTLGELERWLQARDPDTYGATIILNIVADSRCFKG